MGADMMANAGSGIRRNIFLYRRSLAAQLRAATEYKSDFWILTAASILMQIPGLVFLSAVFQRIPDINGWPFYEVVLIYATVFFVEGIASLFFEGVWQLSILVNKGELDPLLLRPYSPVLQVMSSRLGVNGIGNVVMGGTLMAVALQHVETVWTPARILLGFVLLMSAITIKVAVNLATNSAAFWLTSPSSSFAHAVHSLGDLARYPITIYSIGIKIVITLFIPLAFVSFYPVSAVLGRGPNWWVGLLTPVVAGYCLLQAYFIFKMGLKRYESAGS
jgi:ABC-2 type transport system permease protein